MKQRNIVLLVVGVQKDFCPGGSLAIGDGNGVVPPENRVAAKSDRVIASFTQPWMPCA